jgi:HEAT repeat protein
MKRLLVCLLLVGVVGCDSSTPTPTPPEETNGASDGIAPEILQERERISQLTHGLLNDKVDPSEVQVTDQLLSALEHEDEIVRQQGAAGLGHVKFDSRIVDPLFKALASDENGVVRVYASMAIHRFDDSGKLDPYSQAQQSMLLAALDDENDLVRANVIGVNPNMYRDNEKAVDALVLLLKDQNDDLRTRAVNLVCALDGHPRLVDPVIALLADKDSYIRRTAATGLGIMRDQRAVPALRAVLHDEDALTRTQVIEAIGSMYEVGEGDLAVVGDILAMLADKEEKVRKQATYSLKKLTGEDFGEDRAGWQQWYTEKKAGK